VRKGRSKKSWDVNIPKMSIKKEGGRNPVVREQQRRHRRSNNHTAGCIEASPTTDQTMAKGENV